MTIIEEKKFCERQIAFYKREVEFTDKDIARTNEMMKKVRNNYKSETEKIWAKGVLTETEMFYVNIGYKNLPEYKKLNSHRVQQYNWRKKCNRNINKYTEELNKLNTLANV